MKKIVTLLVTLLCVATLTGCTQNSKKFFEELGVKEITDVCGGENEKGTVHIINDDHPEEVNSSYYKNADCRYFYGSMDECNAAYDKYKDYLLANGFEVTSETTDEYYLQNDRCGIIVSKHLTKPEDNRYDGKSFISMIILYDKR